MHWDIVHLDSNLISSLDLSTQMFLKLNQHLTNNEHILNLTTQLTTSTTCYSKSWPTTLIHVHSSICFYCIVLIQYFDSNVVFLRLQLRRQNSRPPILGSRSIIITLLFIIIITQKLAPLCWQLYGQNTGLLTVCRVISGHFYRLVLHLSC